MTEARREQLEMAGYSWGRNAKPGAVVYNRGDWTDEERAAFRRGYAGAVALQNN